MFIFSLTHFSYFNVYFNSLLILNKADRDEFNQCQSQLVSLYEALPEATKNESEFIGYRLLYFMMTKSYKGEL